MKIAKSTLKRIIAEEYDRLTNEAEKIEQAEDPTISALKRLQSEEGIPATEFMEIIPPLVSRFGMYWQIKVNFRGQMRNMNIIDLKYNLERGAVNPDDKVFFGDQPGRIGGYSAERKREINYGLNEPPMKSRK